MLNYKRVNGNTIEFGIDTKLFNDQVITKTLYWHSGKYIISQEYSLNSLQIQFEKIEGLISDEEFISLKSSLSQMLIDFKTRAIVNQETKNIREILLIKAFANNDDFDDFNLLAEND